MFIESFIIILYQVIPYYGRGFNKHHILKTFNFEFSSHKDLYSSPTI